MDRIEYKYVDKTEYEIRGSWDNEPDKIQWEDEETKLPCLIVRGPLGALCGYVGVDESHPLFEKDYSDLYDWEKEKGTYIEAHGRTWQSNLLRQQLNHPQP